MLRLTEEYLDYVQAHEYDAAMAMLHDILFDSVRALKPERDSSIRAQQRMFPVVSYHRTAMTFTTPHNVSISYAIAFFEKSLDSDIPNTVVLTFEPQRVDGTWYLELSEGTRAK